MDNNMQSMTFCQSCGMPLERAELVAIESDGGPNTDYCIYCYRDGAFTLDCTMDEMIDISLSHMSSMLGDDMALDHPDARAQLESFFPDLKRWKK